MTITVNNNSPANTFFVSPDSTGSAKRVADSKTHVTQEYCSNDGLPRTPVTSNAWLGLALFACATPYDLVNCEYYDNGSIKSGKTTKNTTINGITYMEKTSITFYDNGQVKEGVLGENSTINGEFYLIGTAVVFTEGGSVETTSFVYFGFSYKGGTTFWLAPDIPNLTADTTINGITYPANSEVLVESFSRKLIGLKLSHDVNLTNVLIPAGAMVIFLSNGEYQVLLSEEPAEIQTHIKGTITKYFIHNSTALVLYPSGEVKFFNSSTDNRDIQCYKSGQIKSVEDSWHNELIVDYHENGNIKTEYMRQKKLNQYGREIVNEGYVLTEIVPMNTYYENGQLESDSDGNTYYENGQQKSDSRGNTYYKNGQLESDSCGNTYYENGQRKEIRLSEETTFSGITYPDHTSFTFYPNGRVSSFTLFRDGKVNGVQYYRNDTIYLDETGNRKSPPAK